MSYFSEVKLIDEYNNQIEGTMMNQLKIAETNRLAGGLFNYTSNGDVPDTTFWTTTNSASGTSTITNSEVNVAVTTSSGSSAEIGSQGIARYMGAASNMFRSVIRMDVGATNNVRRWGAVNLLTVPTDGFFFQLSGTTFQVVRRLAGSDTAISSGSFNGNGTASGQSYSLDTNYHTYEIYYTNKRVMFVIDSVPIHTFTATNAPLSATRHFRPYISNINAGVGSAVSIYSKVMTISRLGKATSQPKSFFQQGTTAGVILKRGPGNIHSIVVSGIVTTTVINIYDGLTTGGTLLWTSGSIVIANQASNAPFGIQVDGTGGIPFQTGLFLAITTANSNVLIIFE